MYIKYLKYVIRHKWFVMLACFKQKQYWRGLVHDNSKFLPSEFIPYARYFYGSYKSRKDANMYEKTYYWNSMIYKEDVKKAFDVAWLKHIHRNKHHWQYWVLREDEGKKKVMQMPLKYSIEMLCDWKGAGKAISGKDDTREWYKKNKDNMILHNDTRNLVDILLS